MRQITKKEWNAIHKDFKGKWTEESLQWQPNLPKEYIGKRSMMEYSDQHGTQLITEGFHFEIID